MEITLVGEQLVIVNDSPTHLGKIRALPSRKWDSATNKWYCPYVHEVYDAMVAAKFPVHHIARPEQSGYHIDRPHGQQVLVVRTLKLPEDIQKCKRIPEYRSFSSQYDGWVCRPTKGNVQYLMRAFPNATWSESAKVLTQTFGDHKTNFILSHAKKGKTPQDVSDFKFPGTPRKHQVTAFSLARDQETFALFMEQRTGKCYVQICEVMDLVQKSKVTGWLIVSPNSVKDVWVEEIQKWMPAGYDPHVFVWEPGTRHKVEQFIFGNVPGERPLKVLIMNVEAFSSPKGVAAAELFLARHQCLMTVDEATRIKTPSAARTKAIIKIGRKARVRRILTGTPVTQGPLDVFAPFKFLDPQILGYSSFYSFRNRYAILGGFNNKQVVAYANLPELQELVDRKSYRVLLKDCTDIKEPIYEKRYVTLTDEQQAIYDSMRDEMVAELGGEKSSVQHAITKILRLAQIIGGFLPVQTDDDSAAGTTIGARAIPGGNPKLDELLQVIEDFPVQKYIIWARFRAEIDLIQRTLRERFGEDAVVEFHGGVTELQRKVNRRRFQDMGDPARFFVGQQQTGGLGIPLYAADLTVFYSNEHSLEVRLQAESRPLLPEKTLPHTYIDLVAKKTYDGRMISGLRSKKGLADLITGDPTLSWL